MKLWSKEKTSTAEMIEQFTVGHDRDFDILMAKFDVLGSIAHVTMLGENGMMEPVHAQQAIEGLKTILSEIESGQFSIDPASEDIHSQVEWMLTQRIGEAGKMIHSGRSRNDQVAVDIKLFLRASLFELKQEIVQLFDLLIEKSEKHKNTLIPGYTHLQIAMPSSIGLWLGAYAESLVDDMEFLATAWNITNKNPLGSGAGYGSSFPLNRKRTTALLKFKTLNYNSIYAQMSRGKTEKLVSTAIASVASTLGRLSMDCCLFMNQNFGFIHFPDELTTGSSIMPHKKNPDVFELVRGKCSRIQAVPNELSLLINNLPSGYHREMQLTKEILFPAMAELSSCIQVLKLMFESLSVRENILQDEKYKYLFSVEALNELVNQGIPFRDAYAQIGNQIDKGEFNYDTTKPLKHTHEGSISNLCNDEIRKEMNQVAERIEHP
ncbi:MAG: argininosuccinate lyase [Chitinophagaceae bacterium]|nr:MAG: argininosuccinate lyase [Chitinophagaceae bacterium]